MYSKRELTKSSSAQHCQGRVAMYALIALAVLTIGAISYWINACPCERIPGAYLAGERVEESIEDWSFANQVQLCQIQTNSGVIPHAINLNCAADTTGNLFLSCAQCEGKRWSTAATQNPEARIRLDGLVYPVTLARRHSH